MMGELAQLPNPDGVGGSLMDAIDIVVPHQANKNMVLTLSKAAGIPGEKIFFQYRARRQHLFGKHSAGHS